MRPSRLLGLLDLRLGLDGANLAIGRAGRLDHLPAGYLRMLYRLMLLMLDLLLDAETALHGQLVFPMLMLLLKHALLLVVQLSSVGLVSAWLGLLDAGIGWRVLDVAR